MPGAPTPSPIRPPRLREGGTIGVVSPSSALSSAAHGALDRGVAALEGLGFRVRLGPGVGRRHRWTAGTRDERLAELHGMWADPEIGAILMSQGGAGANHLLDGLDHRLLAARPTVLLGHSDGTALVTAIAHRGIVTFHGPNVCWGFGRPMADAVVDQLLDVVVRGAAGAVPARGLRVLREGRAAGPLWGGHANTLALTLLAGATAVPDGAVLLLEDTGAVDRFDRVLTALRLSGALDRVSGVVLGQVAGHGLPGVAGAPPGDVVLDVTRERPVPVVEIADLGHEVDNLTFPIGVPVTVDTAEGLLRLDEPAVA